MSEDFVLAERFNNHIAPLYQKIRDVVAAHIKENDAIQVGDVSYALKFASVGFDILLCEENDPLISFLQYEVERYLACLVAGLVSRGKKIELNRLECRVHLLPEIEADMYQPTLGGFGFPGQSWGFKHRDGTLVGFITKTAAAISARLIMKVFHTLSADVLPKLPCEAYEAFLYGKKWAFFDSSGAIHSGLTTEQDAIELAQKIKTHSVTA